MRKVYDFSEARRNPYAKQMKKQPTIRLDIQTFERVIGETPLDNVEGEASDRTVAGTQPGNRGGPAGR